MVETARISEKSNKMRKEYEFIINGYKICAEFEESLIQETLLPFFQKIEKRQTGLERQLVFLAAPCGAGKSTLAALIEHLSSTMEGFPKVQALGMDGFHYPQSYILTHTILRDGQTLPMKQVKGCPETFAFEKLKQKLIACKSKNVLWPTYNRMLHDVEEDQIEVHAPILLIEGNYLLLDEEPWKELAAYCDASIFIDTSIEEIKRRLMQRKMMGGMAPHEALAFCESSDLPNARRILNHRLPADLTLMLKKGTLSA